MTAREWVSPSVRVTQTSMGTIAMTEMDVIQPTIARPRTESETAGAAYVRNLHTAQGVKNQAGAGKRVQEASAPARCSYAR